MTQLSSADLAGMRSAVEELFPDTCDILSLTIVADGQGGQTETWGTATASAKCRFDFVSGDEQMAAGAEQVYKRAMLSLHYDTVITPANRILYEGNTYNVISVNDTTSWIVAKRAEVELIR